MRSAEAAQQPTGAMASGDAATSLAGSRRLLARLVWIILSAPGLVLFVVGLPVYFQRVQSPCVGDAACFVTGTLHAEELHRLASLGISSGAYAAALTGFSIVSIAIWGGVGLLIFWRRPDDWLALLAAFLLVGAGEVSASGGPAYALTLAVPSIALLFGLVNVLGQATLMTFFLLFPNGRMVPRWTMPLLILGIVFAFANSFPSAAAPYADALPPLLFSVANFFFPAGLIIIAQVYRYLRVDTPLQRQQTKWIVVGFTAAIGLSIPFYILAIFNTDLANNIVFEVIWSNSFSAALLLIPVAFGISILRYRLYDIDVIINRALVYGSLTAILAAVYVVGVVGSQAIIGGFTHSAGQIQSPVSIVVTTLVIAALFQPLRRRLQATIDRRFYRRKYDAEHTLASFGATLREQVDLPELTDHLLGAVDETMQPAQLSLWLRRPDNSV